MIQHHFTLTYLSDTGRITSKVSGLSIGYDMGLCKTYQDNGTKAFRVNIEKERSMCYGGRIRNSSSRDGSQSMPNILITIVVLLLGSLEQCYRKLVTSVVLGFLSSFYTLVSYLHYRTNKNK